MVGIRIAGTDMKVGDTENDDTRIADTRNADTRVDTHLVDTGRAMTLQYFQLGNTFSRATSSEQNLP